METLRRRTALYAAAGLMAILSACAGGQQVVPVDIRDTSASVVSIRAEWHPRTRVFGPEEIKDGVEIQYLRMQGNGNQELQPNQALVIGGGTIVGPQLVSHRADVTYAHIAYGGTGRGIVRDLDIDVLMGVGRVDLDLRSNTTTSVPIALHTKESEYGISLGGGLRWWFITSTAVEGRFVLLTQNPFSLIGGGFGNGGQTDMLASELALVFRPIDCVALRAGYATMDLTPRKTRNDSSIDIKLRGPFLGLGISF